MRVDRCVCRDVSFARLAEIARSERLDFDALVQRTGCSSVCALCGPYVRLMIRTGETSFDPSDPRIARDQQVLPSEALNDDDPV